MVLQCAKLMEAEAPKQFDETAVPDKINAHARPSHGLTNPGAKSVKEYSRRRSPLGAPFAVGTSGTGRASKSKRLSATDISALASMKNAAKCDTWCELQNPVNHRVFERKLRPRPSCQGHVCLTLMTHQVSAKFLGGKHVWSLLLVVMHAPVKYKSKISCYCERALFVKASILPAKRISRMAIQSRKR